MSRCWWRTFWASHINFRRWSGVLLFKVTVLNFFLFFIINETVLEIQTIFSSINKLWQSLRKLEFRLTIYNYEVLVCPISSTSTNSKFRNKSKNVKIYKVFEIKQLRWFPVKTEKKILLMQKIKHTCEKLINCPKLKILVDLKLAMNFSDHKCYLKTVVTTI